MPTPRVSIILPVKDGEHFVATTMKSLLHQLEDADDLEIIAISDGSTDATADVLKYFGAAFKNFTLIENSDAVGLASARNQGLDRASGRLIGFVDGDDWMEKGRLQSLADSLERFDCDFVRADHVTVTGHSRVVVRAPFPTRGVVVSPREGINPADRSTMVDYPYAWAGLFHRRLLDRGLLRFPEGLFTAEDRPWIWNLSLNAESFAVVDAPQLLYRRAVEGSLTQILDARQLDFIRAFDLTRRVVESATDGEPYLFKLTWTTLAVSAHHLGRSAGMTKEDRATLRAGVTALIAALPADQVAEALRRGRPTVRRTLRPYLPKTGA